MVSTPPVETVGDRMLSGATWLLGRPTYFHGCGIRMKARSSVTVASPDEVTPPRAISVSKPELVMKSAETTFGAGVAGSCWASTGRTNSSVPPWAWALPPWARMSMPASVAPAPSDSVPPLLQTSVGA